MVSLPKNSGCEQIEWSALNLDWKTAKIIDINLVSVLAKCAGHSFNPVIHIFRCECPIVGAKSIEEPNDPDLAAVVGNKFMPGRIVSVRDSECC